MIRARDIATLRERAAQIDPKLCVRLTGYAMYIAIDLPIGGSSLFESARDAALWLERYAQARESG